MSEEFYWIAVAVVTVIASARLTRLVTYDVFPPTRWIREVWGEVMDRSAVTRGYAVLTYCQWCFSFWATLPLVLWGYYTDFQPAWWLVNGSLAGSYLAAIFMTNDTDVSHDTSDEESA